MSDAIKASNLINVLQKTKVPKTIPKLARDAAPALMRFADGTTVDRQFQDGLLRHFGAYTPGVSRDLFMLTLDEESAGDFAMTMFEAWERAGFNGRYDWVLNIIGMLGDERSSLKMEGLIQGWQHDGDTSRKRAISAMRVFRTMDSPTALMALVGLTHRQDVPSVYDAAVSELHGVSKQRHMQWHDLSDSVIPDCGLDARGTRQFDLGGRSLQLVLDSEFEPVLRDAQRTQYDTIPDASPGDDPEKVERARAMWALMQAKLHGVIRIQTRRMEEAMITGRKWAVPRWREVIMEHPLMTNFARRLVWGHYNEAGELLAIFRASTDDHTLIDVEDNEVELDAEGQVGLLHPIEMTQAMRQKWSDSFADYELFAPFDQLGRQVFETSPEVKEKSLLPDQTLRYTSVALRAVMKSEGWRRPTGGGMTRGYFYKRFEGYQHVAYIDLDPGLTAGGESWDPSQLIKGIRIKKLGVKQETPVMINHAPAVCVSEAMRFLALVEEQQA